LEDIIADPDTKGSCKNLLKTRVLDAFCGFGKASDAKDFCEFVCTAGMLFCKLHYYSANYITFTPEIFPSNLTRAHQ